MNNFQNKSSINIQPSSTVPTQLNYKNQSNCNNNHKINQIGKNKYNIPINNKLHSKDDLLEYYMAAETYYGRIHHR